MDILPDVVNEINKRKKTIKITTLDKAVAFKMKRFFSGSFAVDYMTGGGFVHRRIQLLFGGKSCIDGDSFLYYEVWTNNRRTNGKGGTIRRLYERFIGDTSEGSKCGRHLQNNDATFYVKSVDDTGRVIRNEILDVVKAGRKECFKVTVALGKELISTKEHKYLTPEGYKELGELKVGDILYVNTNNRVKGRIKTITRPAVCVKYHPYFPIKIVKEKYKGKEKDYIYYRGQTSRIVYEAFLNNMSYADYVNILNTKSKEEINALSFLPENIHVHHKDENFLNNDLDNLELIDPSEHGRLHMQDRLQNLQIIVEETHITSIEYVGERDTFDIQCAYPYNNYIANGIVVHNSGKNALLHQMTAYLQRQCRLCGAIHPQYILPGNKPADRWTAVLRDIMGYGVCKCEKPEPKRVYVLDYERVLGVEQPRTITIVHIVNKKTGEEIDELDYNDALAFLAEMKATEEKLTDEQKAKIKETETYLKNTQVKEQVIRQIAVPDYLKKCGVNANELLVSDPEDTEEGIELVSEVVRSKQADAIIWDSLQAAIPRWVKDRGADQATMGVEAKQNGLLMRQVCSAFAAKDLTDESEAYKPALFITSQVRASIGGFVASQPTYSGGFAVQHFNSFALELKKEKFLREDGTDAPFEENFYGQRVRLRADKNKISAPGDMFWFDYYFREGDKCSIGIDSISEIVELASDVGAIEKAGTWYKMGEQSIQGLAQLKALVKENPAVARELYMKVLGKI